MKVTGYSVTVSRGEVMKFKQAWPCSSLPDREVTFRFDARGDLVEIEPYDVDGDEVAGLSRDARNYLLPFMGAQAHRLEGR